MIQHHTLETMSVHLATQSDIESIIGLDRAQAPDPQHGVLLGAIDAESVWISVIDDQVVGFVIVDYTFFGCGFISALHTHPSHRRQGVGTALIQQVETKCRTEKLFTSTNESNHPMQELLATCDFAPSGVIHNLDDGDPELFYFKAILRK